MASRKHPAVEIADEVRAKNGHAKPSDKKPESKPITAAELLAMEFPDPSYTVPGIITEGVTILASKPKIGKTWMVLGIGVAVASGGYALGKTKVEQGSVLALMLEDNLRRVRSRLQKILQGGKAPEKLEITTEWPRLHEGGVEKIEAWLEEHPDARLVVIDTLAKARQPGRGNNVYQEDYSALERLLPLAAKYHVSILVVTHLRKMEADDPIDEINSSTGLTAGVDGILVLKRQRGKPGAFLHVTGRDIEEEKELGLKWDPATASWTIEGDADEVRLSGARAEIVELLKKQGGPMTPKEMASMLGKGQNAVYQLVYQMSSDGQLETPDRGLYALPGNKVRKDNKDDKDNKDRKASSSLFDSPSPNKDLNKDENPIGKGNHRGNDPNLIDLSGFGGVGAHKNGLTSKEVAAEFARHGSGSGKNLAVYLRGETTLEILTRSVLTGLGRDPADWRHYATLVGEAARDGRNHPSGCPCPLCDDGAELI